MLRSQTLLTSQSIDYTHEFSRLAANADNEPGWVGFRRLFAIFTRFDDGDRSKTVLSSVEALLKLGVKTDGDAHYYRKRFSSQSPDAWLLVAGLPTMRALFASGTAAQAEHKGMVAAGALVCALTAPGPVSLELISRISRVVVSRLSRAHDPYLRRQLKSDRARETFVAAILDRWASRPRPALAFVPQPIGDFNRALSRAGAFIERLVERVGRSVIYETHISRASHFRYSAAARAAGKPMTPSFVDAHKNQLQQKQHHKTADGLEPIAAWAGELGTTRTTLTKGIERAVLAGAIQPPKPFQGARVLSRQDAMAAMSFVKQKRTRESELKEIANALGLEIAEVKRTQARLRVEGGNEINWRRELVEEIFERHPELRAAFADGRLLLDDVADAEHTWMRRREL